MIVVEFLIFLTVETNYKIGDLVCQKGTGNYPRMKVMAINNDGLYRCFGTNHRLNRKKVIDKFFKEDELEFWINHSGVITLRDKSTFR
ncbi:hypothetical protein GCM10028827_17100 [Mucilaginibacter myungsuensis]